ncbi:triggering receptor expressed on myeloid cells 2-like isoform X2 [Bufo gargarizans]|uniref:triggering receptor expressed on myeloid cells 2-like isoform X2 n=1 Tax=Bufo gargarizans TaxID=30331 RepID=UPI001CF25AEA|nr:triggering receptor expressed on myeloid cells 2-like isoform X2 [Bufo gargarizans]
MDKCFSLSFTVILLGTLGWCLAKDITVYSGQLGETLNIVCPYQQRADRWKKKVWCKEDEDGFCQSVVSVHSYWINIAKRTNGSADISDNYQKGIIIINMTNLQKSDSGVYQCRTVTFGDVSTLQRIQVQVLEDQQKESVSELENTQYSISGIYSTSVDQEPFTMPLSAGHSDVEYSLPTAREEDDDSPQYINYIQMGYLNQAHYQQ